MSDSTSSSHRCPTCQSTSVNARNLAVFIDGTSNKPGDEKTNVVKLYDGVSDGESSNLKQSKLYLKGIGTYDADNSSLLDRVEKEIYNHLEMTLAWNVEKNVKNAYGWLADEYQEGDQIYLFGFSRGAYQVRALAGMIHEVGLVKLTQQKQSEESVSMRSIDPNDPRETRQEQIEGAYRNYRSIDPNDPETRRTAIEFKKNFCWPGVRIHFVGVWDTVSSLGFIKQDVHITASASVTNACHFRHALALDERRVKFIPEYFSEVNAHRIGIESPRSAVSDVKEVWFAGHHSDVGGTSRPHVEVVPKFVDDDPYPTHAGNVPLLWMKQEAVGKGLVFKPDEFSWDPKDVDLGREEAMDFLWRLVETLPIRHQVSFSGTGKHARRLHLFRPRSVIPHQHVHSSILSGDLYTPRATLRDGVGIPTVPRITSGGLWVTELPDEGSMTRSLTPLLRDPQTALGSLGQVLFLLSSNNGRTQTIIRSQWSEEFIGKQFDFARFALAVIYDVTSNFSISEELVKKAQNSLVAILSSPNQPYFPGTLEVLRFSTRNERLRRRFIAQEKVIGALLHALERTTESQRETLSPLVMNILCYLIGDDDQRGNVINQLNARSALSETGKTRLSLILEVKAPSHLMASLKMIASLARHQRFLCRELKPRIIELAKKGRGSVGSAAVEALVALNGPFTRDVRFPNILGYFDNTLPRLDAEVGSMSSPDVTVAFPPVFQVNGAGELDNGDMVMRELVRTINSRDAHECTVATFTLLKLCRYSIIRDFCSRNKVLDIFVKQLERGESSLLAAYALKTCLTLDMWTADDFDFDRVAQLIVAMFNKGWFDDAVGQVEGSEIFRELMTSVNLRQQVIKVGIVATLRRNFECGECHDVRMSLICLDILERESLEVAKEIRHFVTQSLACLLDKKKKTQMKGVKILSALAQTKAGEKAIKPRVIDIVTMLLPHAGQSYVPRSQLFGPIAALHNLSRNETLRKEIKDSPEYAEFKRQCGDRTLYPGLRSDQRFDDVVVDT